MRNGRLKKEANEKFRTKKITQLKDKILSGLRGRIKFMEENIGALITD